MNMISTGAFLPETDASTKQNELVKKLTAAWEKKNSKTARAGGASLMALSLAACGGEDNTPFSAADVSAAEAAATTAALTGADGTVYASVDAAVTSNDTAIADAARAEGVASVDITSDNTEVMMSQADYDAAIAAADDDLQASYDALVASNAALQASYDALTTGTSQALTTSVDVLSGTAGDDTFTATTATDDATDIIVDTSTSDSDVLNYAVTGNSLAITVTNVETVNVTSSVAAATALTVDASEYTGVTALNVTRGDLANGAIDGSGTVTVSGVQGASVASVNAVSGVDIFTVTQATTAGTTVNATGVTGNVSVTGAGTVNANDSTGTVALTALGVAAQDALALDINAAAAGTVTTAAGFTGAITIDAAVATSVDVDNATGGATITAATTPATGATTIAVGNVDDTGVTITAGTFTSTATGAVNIEGTTGTSDTATITAGAAVALNTNSDGANTHQVENLVLGGNGATATFTINTGDAIESITTTGTQLVNVTIDSDDVSSETVTGVNNLELAAAGTGAVDLTNVSAALIDFGADIGQTITVAGSGETIKIDVDQTGLTLLTNVDGSTITIQAGDDTAGSAQSTIALAAVDMNDTKDFGTINLVAETARITATSFDTEDAALNISGDENVTFTGDVTTGNIDASGHTGILTMTLDDARTLTTGSAADAITMNDGGAGNVQTVNTGAGNDTVTITDAGVGSVVTTGAGADTINIDQTNAVSISGGEGNDSYDISADSDVSIVDEAGTDNITFDVAAARDLSNNDNFSFTGIETIDITAVNAAVTMDAADLSGKTLTITGDAAADIIKAVGDDGGTATAETIDLSGLTISGTATIQIDGGDKADTLIGSATEDTTFLIGDGDVDSGEVITGGTGTDTIDGSALTAAIDLSVATITSVESFNTNGMTATIGQGTGIVDVDGYVHGTADSFTLMKSTTSFEASAETSAAAVNIAGEWFFAAETAGAGNGAKLTFFDEVLGEAKTIEFDGTENAGNDDTAAMVAGSLVVTIA